MRRVYNIYDHHCNLGFCETLFPVTGFPRDIQPNSSPGPHSTCRMSVHDGARQASINMFEKFLSKIVFAAAVLHPCKTRHYVAAKARTECLRSFGHLGWIRFSNPDRDNSPVQSSSRPRMPIPTFGVHDDLEYSRLLVTMWPKICTSFSFVVGEEEAPSSRLG